MPLFCTKLLTSKKYLFKKKKSVLFIDEKITQFVWTIPTDNPYDIERLVKFSCDFDCYVDSDLSFRSATEIDTG